MLLTNPATALATLTLALALDALIGDPPWLWRRLPHPVVLLGRLIAKLEAVLLDRADSPPSQRFGGVVLLLVTTGVATAIGLVLHALLALLPLGWVLEAALIAVLLAQKSLVQHVKAVADGLKVGPAEGRRAVAMIVGRDVEALDGPAVARAAIESLAENLSDGVVAPAFYALLFGLPGILAYKAINTLDSSVGYRTERHLHFGRASALTDDAVNWPPARLTALMTALAAGRRAGAALAVLRRDAGKHRSPNAGHPEAAFAGALGVRLSGPRRYHGETRPEPWVGDGTPDLGPADIERAVRYAWRVWGLMFAGVVLVWAVV